MHDLILQTWLMGAFNFFHFAAMAESADGAVQKLKDLIKAVPDFPKPGILFRYS